MSPTRSTTNPGLQFSQDVNEVIEDGIRLGLSTIPVIGDFLVTLIQVLWPWGNSNTDVWDSIKAQVEQLIDQKLEQQTYEAAILKLQALNNNMHDYLLAVQTNQSNPTNGVITKSFNGRLRGECLNVHQFIPRLRLRPFSHNWTEQPTVGNALC